MREFHSWISSFTFWFTLLLCVFPQSGMPSPVDEPLCRKTSRRNCFRLPGRTTTEVTSQKLPRVSRRSIS